MTYEQINRNDYYDIVWRCFEGDDELMDRWHVVAPASLNNAVDDTVNVLRNELDCSFKFFKVLLDSDVIGFFGTEKIL